MSESLASRVGRLVSGSLASLVDALEGVAPDMVMQEALREIDRAIDEVRAELGRVLSAKHLTTTRLAEENRKHDDLTEKARVAVESGREDLAEAAVSRLLDIEAQIPVLETAITSGAEDEAQLERYIAALQARKREMTVELEQFRSNKRAEERAGGLSAQSPSTTETSVRNAEQVFDRVMQSAAGTPATADMPSPKDAVKLAELDQLTRANRIKERLAALKATTTAH